jgi:hypothetical protein
MKQHAYVNGFSDILISVLPKDTLNSFPAEGLNDYTANCLHDVDLHYQHNHDIATLSLEILSVSTTRGCLETIYGLITERNFRQATELYFTDKAICFVICGVWRCLVK